jgi:hypothetical protein
LPFNFTLWGFVTTDSHRSLEDEHRSNNLPNLVKNEEFIKSLITQARASRIIYCITFVIGQKCKFSEDINYHKGGSN